MNDIDISLSDITPSDFDKENETKQKLEFDTMWQKENLGHLAFRLAQSISATLSAFTYLLSSRRISFKISFTFLSENQWKKGYHRYPPLDTN